ncbi:MAG: ADP-forming succinate--CoA ligase subunit beta, partial [Acidobacteria bacterium]|nr:ADP-forming succinate--CoA ligase subunit beta [Acidobacteriota bacterium]
AQIHAGGRGKGGGVKMAGTPEEAGALAEGMLGMTLVTPQTGPAGREVKTLLIEQALEISREFYLGLLVDRTAGVPVIVASSAGGMEIERVAEQTPELIQTEIVDPAFGLQAFQARRLAAGIGLPSALIHSGAGMLMKLDKAFTALDASLIEINPLVITAEGALLALDAKITLDDNALFRHADLATLRDLNEEDPLEIEAGKHDLNYIKLSGEIGCMVNGAGLAMATMDIIKLAGGEPANFLDIGGGASAGRVENAFRILLSDPNVRAVLINIFGGIVRCDLVAQGVLDAIGKTGLRVPMVVRLEGTNVEKARELLEASGLRIAVGRNMRDAAGKVVALARG